MKFDLDFHRVYMAMVTNAEQRSDVKYVFPLTNGSHVKYVFPLTNGVTSNTYFR